MARFTLVAFTFTSLLACTGNGPSSNEPISQGDEVAQNEPETEETDEMEVEVGEAEPIKGITATVQRGAFWLEDGTWSILTAGEHYWIFGVATSEGEDGTPHENPYLVFAGGEREGQVVLAECLLGLRGKQEATEDCPAFECQVTDEETDCKAEPDVEDDVEINDVDKVLASLTGLTVRVIKLEGHHPSPEPATPVSTEEASETPATPDLGEVPGPDASRSDADPGS